MGLAAFAAAAISRGDPIRTGIQGFSYDIRTAVLPFMFIFNTDILLIDVGWVGGLTAVLATSIGMLAFCSATQRYMLAATAVGSVFCFSWPSPYSGPTTGSTVLPPFLELPGSQVVQHLETQAAGGSGPCFARVSAVLISTMPTGSSTAT